MESPFSIFKSLKLDIARFMQVSPLIFNEIQLLYLLQDGTSHYLKGLTLLLCYVVIGACFFVSKTPLSKALQNLSRLS
jgi:Ca2+:H+ antiporter